MNDPHDNAQDDRDALEEFVQGEVERILDPDPATGEVHFEPDETPRSGYDPLTRSLTSMDGAAWAARKLREVQEELDRNERTCDEELAALEKTYADGLAAIDKRHQAADAPFLPGLLFFKSILEVYAMQNRAEVLKGLPKDRKSRLLSGVRIGWRSSPVRYDVTDTGTLLDWAKANGQREAIFPEPKPEPIPELGWFRRSAFNDWAKKQKTLPDAVKVVPSEETLEITFSKEKP